MPISLSRFGGCWAWRTGIGLSSGPSRSLLVGGGRCLPLRACWSVRSAGHGVVVGVVGPPGIGKSRLVREVSAMAAARGVEVFTAFCESHASQVAFDAVARLLRAAIGVDGLEGDEARDRVRDRVPDADPEDLVLFDDLLGIADPDGGSAENRSGCASAAVDRAGECRLVGT